MDEGSPGGSAYSTPAELLAAIQRLNVNMEVLGKAIGSLPRGAAATPETPAGGACACSQPPSYLDPFDYDLISYKSSGNAQVISPGGILNLYNQRLERGLFLSAYIRATTNMLGGDLVIGKGREGFYTVSELNDLEFDAPLNFKWWVSAYDAAHQIFVAVIEPSTPVPFREQIQLYAKNQHAGEQPLSVIDCGIAYLAKRPPC